MTVQFAEVTIYQNRHAMGGNALSFKWVGEIDWPFLVSKELLDTEPEILDRLPWVVEPADVQSPYYGAVAFRRVKDKA